MSPLDLGTYRQKIDDIDREILELLTQRAKISIQIGDLKYRSNQEDLMIKPQREANILSYLSQKSSILSSYSVCAIWREIISACRGLEKVLRVAHYPSTLNPMSIYGHQVLGMSCCDASDALSRVDERSADIGIILVEDITLQWIRALVSSTCSIMALYQQQGRLWALAFSSGIVEEGRGYPIYLFNSVQKEKIQLRAQSLGIDCLFMRDYDDMSLCIFDRQEDNKLNEALEMMASELIYLGQVPLYHPLGV